MKHGLKYTVGRRQFLRLSALAASGSIMLACGPSEAPAAGGDDMGMAEDGIVDVYVWPSIALVRPEGSDPEKYKEVQDYITEQLGIRPNGFVPPPGAAGRERLNLMLSSQTEQLDMFTGDWTQYKAAIMPITDLLEEHGQNILTAFPEATWSGMKDANGDIWGIPRLGLMGHTWNFTWFREDWINELGLPFNSEEMTIDQLEGNMAAFQEANPDAVLVTNNLGSLEGCLLGAWSEYGRSRWYDESDGQIKPYQLQPGYEAFLGKMNEWWNNGWFHKEVFANMDFEEVLRSGNMGIHCGWYSRMTILGQRIFLEDVIPGMDFIFPLKMVGPMGLAGTNNANMTQAYMIPANSPVAKEVIQFVNWQYDPVRDNAVTAHYGMQGTDWDWVDETKEQVRRHDAGAGAAIYAGELYQGAGLAIETWSAPEDPLWGRHYDHIKKYVFDYSNGKMPVDFDVPYDGAAIAEQVPSMEDINRLNSEEAIKFITGVRPLSEFGDFVDSLYRAGLQDWIDAYTSQYVAAKGL